MVSTLKQSSCRSGCLTQDHAVQCKYTNPRIRAAYFEDIYNKGYWWCEDCKEELPLTSFYLRKTTDRAGKPSMARCKKHASIFNSIVKARINYKVNYEEMLSAQDSVCAICKSDEPSGKGRFRIDHDHKCCPDKLKSCGKCVRGLLCNKCNVALAMFEDDPIRMERAIAYVTR